MIQRNQVETFYAVMEAC